MIHFNNPPTPTPKPKPVKDGWGKWYNTPKKTQTFAEHHQINPQATFNHTTDNLTPTTKDHYNEHLSNQLEQKIEQHEDPTTTTLLYIALYETESTLEMIHTLQRNIRKLIEQHLQQQQ